MIVGFLLGIVVTGFATAGAFFLRFWVRTRDPLFLAFSFSFFIEAGNRLGFMGLDNPNEVAVGIYLVRLASYLLILLAIVHKNLQAPPQSDASHD